MSDAWYAVDRLFRADFDPGTPVTVAGLLDRRADLLWRAYQAGDPAVMGFLDEREGLTLDQVRTGVAHQYHFRDWAAVQAEGGRPVDPRFELAIDALVSGDEDGLRELLRADPELARARSAFGHHAMLVHYVAANGVESHRQWQTPVNAVALLRQLLAHGADPDATCDTYSGDNAQTPLCLLVSSMHPAVAGVQADLVTELCRGGADPNGRDDDGRPLWTAITFGYRAAAEALARSGARVDNLVFAAALGDIALVEQLLRGAARECRIGVDGPVLEAERLPSYALIYAAGLGQVEAVRRLLTHDPDLSLIEPVFHSTALGRARYHGQAAVEQLLTLA